MRCKGCNAPLTSLVRTVYVPHPTKRNQKTTIQVEEDLCSKCSGVGMAAAKDLDFLYENSDEINFNDLGIDIPEANFDYFDSY